LAFVLVRADDDEELLRRYRWFREEAEHALNYFPLRAANVTLSAPALWHAVKAHFLIIDAYKADHFIGERTEDAKIAAATGLAIVTFKPFRVRDPANVISPWAARANEFFSIRLAGPILNSGLPELSESDRMAWLLNFLCELKIESLQPLLRDAAASAQKESYQVDLAARSPDGRSDLRQLEILMLIYHVLWRPLET
jgi:hypothetical protein